jgi:Lar family restriction alleviation protein
MTTIRPEIERLKGCPFCGSDPKMIEDRNYRTNEPNGEWYVICHRCDVMLDFDPSEEAAAKRWNTRSTIDRLTLPAAEGERARREVLEDALGGYDSLESFVGNLEFYAHQVATLGETARSEFGKAARVIRALSSKEEGRS